MKNQSISSSLSGSETVDRLLDEGDTARLLGCSKESLRRWRQTNQGPRHLRLGERLIRYRIEDVNRYLRGRLTEPTLTHQEQDGGFEK